MGFGSILLHGAMLVTAPVHPPCNPIPGAERLTENRQLRWIVVGEMHGTNESPAAFLDLVCATSVRRPVVVAVEQSVLAQDAIDAFISSDGSAAARGAFLKSMIWTAEMKDGRSSEAYFRLFDKLRAMKATGRVKRVIAFQPNSYPGPGESEKLMAEELKSRSGKRDLVIVLAGNLHARLTPFPFSPNPYPPMAAHLPAKATASIDVRSNGGAMWACMADGCGPKSMLAAPKGPSRGVVFDKAVAEGYTGVLFLGVPATASPPQKAE